MFFRNASLFRFSPDALPTDLEAALDGARLKPCGPLQTQSLGFVSPFGRNAPVLVHVSGDCELLVLGSEDKLLPGTVVQAEIEQRIEALEASGRSVGRRQRQQIKDEVLTELLPRAFCRPGRVAAYLDRARGWLVVDSASPKAGELLCSALREALGSFPAQPAMASQSPRALLTAWLQAEALPEDFELGEECELRDGSDQGAIVRCRRQDLGAAEIHEHLRAGKEVFQLGLIYDGRIGFVLGEDLKLRKLRFLDTVVDQLEAADRESAQAELAAVFTLMTLELRRLIERLDAIFGLSEG